MDHVREYYRHSSEILREEYESLISSIHLRYILDHTTIFSAKCIDTDMEIREIVNTLQTRRKSRVFETEQSDIDTFVDGILLLTLDTSSRCDHSSVAIERDEDGLSSRHHWNTISRYIRLSYDAFLTQVGFESFSDKCMHR